MRTSLYEEHVALGGKIVDFAGWDLPIQYENLKDEVLAVREKLGVFDVSHMGEFLIEGEEASLFVDYLIPNDLMNLPEGKAIYSPLCNEHGFIIDDLIAYKLSSTRIMLCVNAANVAKDFAWIQSRASRFKVEVSDLSESYSLIAVQGPLAYTVLRSSSALAQLQDTESYTVQIIEDGRTPILAARTGYSGEDGFEIFGDHMFIHRLWRELMDKDVKPCGLGARDVLRLEACYPLYGNELSINYTPKESSLAWTVKPKSSEYIGQEAITKGAIRSRLIKLSLDKAVPRAGYKVYNQDDKEVGEVTSGTLSPTLGKGIAIARVNLSAYSKEDHLFIEIRNKRYPATTVTKAFYTRGVK